MRQCVRCALDGVQHSCNVCIKSESKCLNEIVFVVVVGPTTKSQSNRCENEKNKCTNKIDIRANFHRNFIWTFTYLYKLSASQFFSFIFFVVDAMRQKWSLVLLTKTISRFWFWHQNTHFLVNDWSNKINFYGHAFNGIYFFCGVLKHSCEKACEQFSWRTHYYKL